MQQVRRKSEPVNHFSALLRQRLSCLHASLGSRLQTSFNSKWIQELESQNPGKFVTIAPAPDNVKKEYSFSNALIHLVDSLEDITGEICQSNEVHNSTRWAIYVDSQDQIATELLHSLLSLCSINPRNIDLRTLNRFGHQHYFLKENIPNSGIHWLKEILSSPPICQTISFQLENFFEVYSCYFEKIEAVEIFTDGISISLMLQGDSQFSNNLRQMIEAATQNRGHTFIFNNCAATTQLSLTLPLGRLEHQKPQIKSLIVINRSSDRKKKE